MKNANVRHLEVGVKRKLALPGVTVDLNLPELDPPAQSR